MHNTRGSCRNLGDFGRPALLPPPRAFFSVTRAVQAGRNGGGPWRTGGEERFVCEPPPHSCRGGRQTTNTRTPTLETAAAQLLLENNAGGEGRGLHFRNAKPFRDNISGRHQNRDHCISRQTTTTFILIFFDEDGEEAKTKFPNEQRSRAVSFHFFLLVSCASK